MVISNSKTKSFMNFIMFLLAISTTIKYLLASRTKLKVNCLIFFIWKLFFEFIYSLNYCFYYISLFLIAITTLILFYTFILKFILHFLWTIKINQITNSVTYYVKNLRKLDTLNSWLFHYSHLKIIMSEWDRMLIWMNAFSYLIPKQLNSKS